ncbi:MAG: alpha/beta hydrolase [Pseudomonadota bacterium]
MSVSAAQLNLASLEGDAATVARLVELQEGPVVLVGHSYGGSVITEAGAHDKVEHLVYVAGFALDAGQTLSDLIEGQPPAPWQAELYPDAEGYLRLTHAGIAQFFAPDLPPEETALMAVTQGPIKYDTNYHAPKVAAWSMKPTSYVVAANDQIIPPKVQGYFAQKMGAETTTVDAGHVAMLSQPEAVAQVILDAVQTVSDD